MSIRILPPHIINQIAAGEVIERPSSVVKELIENALDAGAVNIQIKLEAGGKNLISVTDDGCGMSRQDLNLSTSRYATSKLQNDELEFKQLGFRGEALAAIAAVGKLKIISKCDGENANEFPGLKPSSQNFRGTKVEVRDLFYATPARLKFLKTETAEITKCLEVVKKIALVNSNVAFELEVDGRTRLSLKQGCSLDRIISILGEEFGANALELKHNNENCSLSGYASLPTFNRRTGEDQYVFVNNRLVKDKPLLGAIKSAYADFLGGGSFPVVVLFLTLPYEEVDVNIHPTKSEVRFRNNSITQFVSAGLRQAIADSGHRASTTVADFALAALAKNKQTRLAYNNSSAAALQLQEEPAPYFINYPLGSAKAQINNSYIVAETNNSLIIVDQHAAHERLIYENFKQQVEGKKVKRQQLASPRFVQLDEKRLELILSIQGELSEHGFELSELNGKLAVTEIPAVLVQYDISKLLQNISDDLIEHGTAISLTQAFEHVLETSACHNAIRAGDRLSIEQMNDILRQMKQHHILDSATMAAQLMSN